MREALRARRSTASPSGSSARFGRHPRSRSRNGRSPGTSPSSSPSSRTSEHPTSGRTRSRCVPHRRERDGRGARRRAESPERRGGRRPRRGRERRRGGDRHAPGTRPGGPRAQCVSRHLEGPGGPDRALFGAAHASAGPRARTNALACRRLRDAQARRFHRRLRLRRHGHSGTAADAGRREPGTAGGAALFTEYGESVFGSRGWLVSLYAALAVGLALLGVGWRYLAVRTA